MTSGSLQTKVEDVEKLEGDATVSFTRGKKRFGFEFLGRLVLSSICIFHFPALIGSEQVKSTATFEEMTADCDLEVQFTLNSSGLVSCHLSHL